MFSTLMLRRPEFLPTRVFSLPPAITALALILALGVFLRNAWVSDDAYIIFRSVEQLFAGNGPTFNPHERVQVYTSPLWYWILSFGRLFTSDLYAVAVGASLVLWTAALIILHRLVSNAYVFLAGVLLLATSVGFYDFTTSGLENPLGYFVVAIYVFAYCRWMDGRCGVTPLVVLLGVAVLVRHDLATLLLLPTVYAFWPARGQISWPRRLMLLSAAVGPLAAWTIFSVVYYGFPFPNTLYAKSNIELSRFEVILTHGADYWRATVSGDLATFALIVGALVIGVWALRGDRDRRPIAALSAGVALNCGYVTWVGGDFMLGRFLSYAFLLSTVVVWLWFRRNPGFPSLGTSTRSAIAATALLVLVVTLGLAAHSPLTSPVRHASGNLPIGVVDERGFYPAASLLRYLSRQELPYFPYTVASGRGIEFRNAGMPVVIVNSIGQVAYHSGLDQVLWDYYGISSPLLARIDGDPTSRVGHICRGFPVGFWLASLDGPEAIEDPAIQDYYRRLRVVTSSREMFSPDRWREIVLLNTVDRRFRGDYASDPRIVHCHNIHLPFGLG